MKKLQVDDIKLTKNGKTLVEKLKAKENGMVLQLNSLFPYGINDRQERPIHIS